ncbi:hypothetical protein AMAG_20264 [Allomyces macrogynus ATCC 38327]|uniref:DEAD-box helicase OB fold domain-containing protein n=1 Tax=Allomyces macrogynus (strain ATCC 38327) TaxID=578462 RepID=A0A0L0T870_ALLM3|nr:hypothetical protein AMAG_20264 [Allomyces macrogynus ATCC 38327]|eukprot:KNE70947.1 hypothetical protein AMAG_20264 [Allomyces macrogynus ATCC 38327]
MTTRTCATNSVNICFLRGYFSQVAFSQPDGRYLTAAGRHAVYIHPSSVLFGKRVPVVAFVDLVGSESGRWFIRGVSRVDPAWVAEAAQAVVQEAKDEAAKARKGKAPKPRPNAVHAVARATIDRPWLVPTSLFLLGYALSLLVVNLHTQHHVTHYDRLGTAGSNARIAGVPPPPPLPPPPSGTILGRPPRFAHSWLPLVGAVSAVIVGVAYLIADACAGDLGRRPPSAAATAGLLSRRGSVSEAAGRFLVVSLSSTSLASLVAPAPRTDTCPLPPRWGSSSSAAPSRTASSTGVRCGAGGGGGPRMVLLDDADVADPDDVDDELLGPRSAVDAAPGSMSPPAVGATASAAEGDPPRTSATARLRYRSKRGLILRCLGGVVGINYAVSKVPAHPYLLSAALLALALAVYSMVDRTRRGFFVSLFVAAVGTLVCHSLTLAGYLAFVQPDLLGTIKAWVPVLIFTTAVGVGSAARVLLVIASRPAVTSGGVGAVATPQWSL